MPCDRTHFLRRRLADLRASLRRAQLRMETERNPEERKVLRAKIDVLRRGIYLADQLFHEVCRLRGE